MKARLLSLIKNYLLLSGLAAHLCALSLVLFKPDWIEEGLDRGWSKLTKEVPGLALILNKPIQYSLDKELADNFESWQPLLMENLAGSSVVYSDQYDSLQLAVDALVDGETLVVAPGVYKEAFTLRASNVTLLGDGHVVLEGEAIGGKAAIVNKGNFNRIVNIECREIAVSDRNGACVRHEGENLKVEHVYFHDSQQGILSGGNGGLIEVVDSRFERLGNGGRAHALYINGGRLHIQNSQILASKNEGHEIKSRASETIIDNSVIASFSNTDSRLLDVPNGGVLVVKNSILAQGPNSSNRDALGYGLEGITHEENRITISNNLILLERAGGNMLLHSADEGVDIDALGNLIVGQGESGLPGFNLVFETREEAGIKQYPYLPKSPDVRFKED